MSRWTWAALLVGLAACPPNPPPPVIVPPGPPPQGIFNAPANPTLVTPVPDTARAVTVTVPKAGGTVTATGADGASFTLTVPPAALAEDTPITLTPLASIGGLPFEGGLVAGVQLAPDGLELSAFATLEVTPSRSVPVDRQIAFGYSTFEDTQELFLTAPEPGAALRLKVLHFSGYGMAAGSPAQAAQQINNQTHDSRSRLLQQLALGLMNTRRQQLGDPTAPTADPYDTFFRDYDAQVLQPRISLGVPTCDFGTKTLNEIFFVERLAQLAGVTYTFNDGEPALFEQIAAQCIVEAKCRRGELLGLLRTTALLGLEGTPVQQSIERELTRCDGGWKGAITWTVTGSSTTTQSGVGTTYEKTITREGSGTMTFIAPPGTLTPQGGGLPVESIRASDRYTEDTVSTNSDPQCLYTQRDAVAENGTATRIRTDGSAYAFLLIQGSTYSLQIAGLEVPTSRAITTKTFERCIPATTDTLKGSNTTNGKDSLGVVITDSITKPVDSADPKHFKGTATLKQGMDPELTITLDWDFTQP